MKKNQEIEIKEESVCAGGRERAKKKNTGG